MSHWEVRHGDCRDVMRSLPADSVDAIVSDPPYGLAFMGKEWDHGVPGVEFWTEALRVAKPGAHLVAFGGTRTFHRLAVAIEDAGWEIRDCLSWLYGSGFPKSLDVGKAIDKMDAAEEQMARRYRFTEWVRSTGVTARELDAILGTNTMGRHYTDVLPNGKQPAIMTREHLEACRHLLGDIPEWVERECDIRSVESRNFAEREMVGERSVPAGHSFASDRYGKTSDAVTYNDTRPATDAAKQWDGWGTALKPAYEPIILARKPLQPQAELAILVPILQEELCKVASFAKTDTHLSASPRISGFLSIAGLLSSTLDALSEHASRFTTETAFALTTDLKILKSCLSRITHACTTKASSETSGVESDVLLADAFSRSVLAKCERLACTTAGETAIALPVFQASGPEVAGLSPNWEPIVLARKPLVGTVAANVTQYGTGGINVDGCRIEGKLDGDPHRFAKTNGGSFASFSKNAPVVRTDGRWPANVCLDEDAAAMFPESRYFYTAKASRREREAGLDGMPERPAGSKNVGAASGRDASNPKNTMGQAEVRSRNHHPTVKPIALMRWLCRLVTPPGGLVLDPFNGSGSTGCAAVLEGFRYLGAELDAEYVEIARKRIAHWAAQTPDPDLFG